MDESDQVFSHQSQTVKALATRYQRVTVLTGRVGSSLFPDNVEIFTSNWRPRKRFKSAISFLRIFFQIVRKSKVDSVFSHMTDVQSALIAIPLKTLKIPHFLWYAHKSQSIYLRFCSRIVTGIISSTEGSIPINSPRVTLIGQAIDLKLFPPKRDLVCPPVKFIHIGRLDPSKNVSEIISSIEILRLKDPRIELLIVGSPSSDKYFEYSKNLMIENEKAIKEGWLRFVPQVLRSELSELLQNSDCFIHAFRGSLDKTLVEATASMLPVISVNHEYKLEFGSWQNENLSITLLTELRGLMNKSPSEVSSELCRRREKVMTHHSLDNWIEKLDEILRR